jgi:hypothetical protein
MTGEMVMRMNRQIHRSGNDALVFDRFMKYFLYNFSPAADQPFDHADAQKVRFFQLTGTGT